MAEDGIRVLLVEDDEDDYALVRALLSEIKSPVFSLKWIPAYESALKEMSSGQYDICLVDYRLGERSGVEFLTDAKESGVKTPAILLTGYGDHDVDLQAMRAGASDYLEKRQITAALLERSIRYTIEHARVNKMVLDLSQKVLSAQEDERKYLAKELHDSIGASLTAIKFGLERKLDAMKKGEGLSDSIHLEDIISMVQAAIKETKRMQKALRPPILDDLGIITALRSHTREFQAINPSMRVETTFDAVEEDIPEHLKIVIYRISQEALNNVAKHSQAHLICVSLGMLKGDLELLIVDDGSGFDLREVMEDTSRSRGMGIASMKERAQFSGGIFSLTSSKKNGTTVRVSWPSENLLSPETDT